jgi:NADH-quinone oxidoreductase subunit L
MTLLPLIPLFPLAGFLFNLLLGTRLREGRAAGGHASPSPIVGYVACGSVALAFLATVAAVGTAWRSPEHTLLARGWTWIPGSAAETLSGTARFSVEWAYTLDPLSSLMALVVTFVGLLIHVYSIGYMAHDKGYARYMAYLNLFLFAMLTLVLGANYAVTFVGWEGVGLCSYLLIGFWFERPSAADAGKKAFIVNRVGDAAFLLALFLIFGRFGTLDYRAVMAQAAAMEIEHAWGGTLTLIALGLFVGACGKSAQLPLHVWLPDAMEGPTPVSALIHAATMVTAGVYLVARSALLFAHAPRALFVVGVVGAVTALFAATIALVQRDIKRVLAYSTISQLGYMFLACGVGAFGAAVFHLATHAFFKALLFLGAGSVIHALSGEQDLFKMGGLRDKLPVTHKLMLVGCLALAGIPFLAGFFSKDEILSSAFRLGGYGRVLWVLGFATALMTAFYALRLYHLTFSGSFRGTREQEHHVHESPAVMTGPLWILAGGSVLAGFVGVPSLLGHPLGLGNGIEHWLASVFAPAHATLRQVFGEAEYSHATEYLLMLGSVGAALAGLVYARRLYLGGPSGAMAWATRLEPLHRVLLHKYYVDELYAAVFVRGLALGGGQALADVDRHVLDGGDGHVGRGLGVNGLAWFVRDLLARASNLWDRWIVDGAVRSIGFVLDSFSYLVRAAQNGQVQQYALSMLMGVFLLIAAGRYMLGLY